jgi:prepilin-type N-terminal cleavage/methylation domain-containing protein/prepilin-type processing-associated H-X9-DG protein
VSGSIKKTGFTLTEMLVTISVVSVVVAILLPVLSRSRAEGKRIMCLSNLRQLCVAAQTYAWDNDDYYPIAYLNDPNPYDSTVVSVCWDFVYTDNRASHEVQTKPGLLWGGQTIGKVQQCPAFKGSANSNDPYTGYNYNTSYIGHGAMEVVKTPAKTTQVRKPQECALFGDGEYSNGANKFMRAPFMSDGDWFQFRTAGTQGYRHGGSTNVAWCDGHANSQKELYTETEDAGDKAKLEKYNRKAKVKIGFLSPDNSAYDLE